MATIKDIDAKYDDEFQKRLEEHKKSEEDKKNQLAEERKRIEEEEKTRRENEKQEKLRRSEEELEPKYQKLIRECLYGENEMLEEICWLETSSETQYAAYNPYEDNPNYSKPISVREAILIKLGISSIPSAEAEKIDYAWYNVEISSLESRKLTVEEKIKVDIAQERKKEFKDSAEQLEDEDLDVKGVIVFKCGDVNFSSEYRLDNLGDWLYGEAPYSREQWTYKTTVEIEITKRQLIKMGLDPEFLGWKSIEKLHEEQKSEVTPTDIAVAEQKSSLPKRVIEAIKGFFDKLKSKGKDDIDR